MNLQRLLIGVKKKSDCCATLNKQSHQNQSNQILNKQSHQNQSNQILNKQSHQNQYVSLEFEVL